MYNLGNWSKGETYAWWLLLAGLGGYVVWSGWLSPLGHRMKIGDRVYVERLNGPGGQIVYPGHRFLVEVVHITGDGKADGSVVGVEGLPTIPPQVTSALMLAGGSLPSFNAADVTRVERKDSSGAYQPLTGSR